MNSIWFLKLFVGAVFTMAIEPKSMVKLTLPGMAHQTALVPGTEVAQLLIEQLESEKSLIIYVMKGDEKLELFLEATDYNKNKLEYEWFTAKVNYKDIFKMQLTLNNMRRLLGNLEFRLTPEDGELSEF